MNQHAILLLLNPEYQFLGEVFVHGGAFLKAVMTDQGELVLGPAVKEWQTRGVPVRRELFGTRDKPDDVVFFQERVQLRDPEFAESLKMWAEERKLIVVTLPREADDSWNKILRLPLTPVERFTILMAVCQADDAGMSSWTEFLDEAIRITMTESERTVDAIRNVQVKAAKSLAAQFAKKH